MCVGRPASTPGRGAWVRLACCVACGHRHREAIAYLGTVLRCGLCLQTIIALPRFEIEIQCTHTTVACRCSSRHENRDLEKISHYLSDRSERVQPVSGMYGLDLILNSMYRVRRTYRVSVEKMPQHDCDNGMIVYPGT